MLRTYGTAPFRAAVIHGGPGAPGSVAPVARELAASGQGILEPLQTADSLDGQVEELRAVLETAADHPLTVIGWSWGAMLSFIVAARCPDLIQKLILVGSGVFEDSYAAQIMPTRLSRLAPDERQAVLDALDHPDSSETMAWVGRLLETKTDSYDLLDDANPDSLGVDEMIYQRVWADAQALRSSGDMLALGRQIRCPVLAIHGDTDPHPVDGIRVPLESVLNDFRLVVLDRCGHTPWHERYARDAFYALLRAELAEKIDTPGLT